jgi:uncharacterized protein YjbI with pentapeptide repeats
MKRSIMLALIALSFGAAFPVMAACTDTAGMEVDWEGCNLSDANLSESDLTGANLSGANLNRAVLKDVNLTGANLSESNLYAATLNRVTLTDANLSGANMSDTWLTDANLRSANLSPAKNLRGGGKYLRGAKLSGVIWTDGRICAAESVGTCD